MYITHIDFRLRHKMLPAYVFLGLFSREITMRAIHLSVIVSAVLAVFFGTALESEAAIRGKRYCRPAKRMVSVKPKTVLGPKVSLLQSDSLDGWLTTGGKTPGSAWEVVEGVLHLNGRGGDIRTEREYKNFILDFAWTIAKGGNSGIKYRFKQFDGKGWLGCEYQVLDDYNTGEGKAAKRSASTLYDILPTNERKHLNPHTELNRGRIVVNGDRLEHWLNGEKVVEVTVGSDRWKEALAKSKFSGTEDFGSNPTGFIMVQDHQCEVWFHEISIQEILSPDSGRETKGAAFRCINPCVEKKITRVPEKCRVVTCHPTYCNKKSYRCASPTRRCVDYHKARYCR